MTEQEQQDAFVVLVGGRQRADLLERIYRDSFPTDDWAGTSGRTREQNFTFEAQREGFKDEEISAFLKL